MAVQRELGRNTVHSRCKLNDTSKYYRKLKGHVSKHQEKHKDPTYDERERSKHVECGAKSTTNSMIILDGE
jgi:hypothetical protein